MSVAVMQSGRCRMHGGASPRGFEHPSTKTALYSRSAPEALGARLALAAKASDRKSVEGEMNLLVGRIDELVASLKNGIDKATYERLIDQLMNLRHAVHTETDPGSDSRDMVEEAIKIATTGHKEFNTWREIRQTVEIVRRAAETEIKAMEKANQVLTMEDAGLMVAMMKAAMQRAIHETGAHHVQAPYNKYMQMALQAKGSGHLLEFFESVNNPEAYPLALPEPETEPIRLPEPAQIT